MSSLRLEKSSVVSNQISAFLMYPSTNNPFITFGGIVKDSGLFEEGDPPPPQDIKKSSVGKAINFFESSMELVFFKIFYWKIEDSHLQSYRT